MRCRMFSKRCNVVFKITAMAMVLVTASVFVAAQTVSVLLKFNGVTDGALPTGGLFADSAGNLYGTNIEGASGYGTVFELSPPAAGGAWTETVLHAFTNSPDGFSPHGPLIMDQAGNLYGTTVSGGLASPADSGMVFELSPPATVGAAWTETILYDFFAQNPNGGLVMDAAGNLYGTTYNGGACGTGSVFELSPPASGAANWNESEIYSFRYTCNGKTDNDGAGPLAGLTIDSFGDLIGTTFRGGTFAQGTVFKLTPPSAGHSIWTEKVIYNFTGSSDGAGPASKLVLTGGKLYGTAEYGANVACVGGYSGCGTVFELTRGAGSVLTETTLYSFTDGNDGANPAGSVSFDKHGNLYTSASKGANSGCLLGVVGAAAGCGAIIELTPPAVTGGPWTETTLYDFTGRGDGGTSLSGLVVGGFGQLYGTTYQGGDPECGIFGTKGCGVVFKIIP